MKYVIVKTEKVDIREGRKGFYPTVYCHGRNPQPWSMYEAWMGTRYTKRGAEAVAVFLAAKNLGATIEVISESALKKFMGSATWK